MRRALAAVLGGIVVSAATVTATVAVSALLADAAGSSVWRRTKEDQGRKRT